MKEGKIQVTFQAKYSLHLMLFRGSALISALDTESSDPGPGSLSCVLGQDTLLSSASLRCGGNSPWI